VGVHKMVSGSSSGADEPSWGSACADSLSGRISDVVWAWESMSAELNDKRPVKLVPHQIYRSHRRARAPNNGRITRPILFDGEPVKSGLLNCDIKYVFGKITCA
jgi:hypothetical protein